MHRVINIMILRGPYAIDPALADVICEQTILRINAMHHIIDSKENKKGPNTMPFGTQNKISSHSEFATLTTTSSLPKHNNKSIQDS